MILDISHYVLYLTCMDSNLKTFGLMLRTIRVSRGMKQREVANLIGCSPATLANAESSKFQLLGKRKVEALIRTLNLETGQANLLLKLHAAAPLSPFQEAQRERWRKAKEGREAIKDHSKLEAQLKLAQIETANATEYRFALIHLLNYLALGAFECGCTEATQFACEGCRGLQALGLADRWTTIAVVNDLLYPPFMEAEAYDAKRDRSHPLYRPLFGAEPDPTEPPPPDADEEFGDA